MGSTLVIQAVGDVAPRRADPASILAPVASLLRDTDVLFGQLECPLSRRGAAAPNAKLAMRSDPAVAPMLRAAGFDALSVAGNHTLDYGAVALADTLEALAEAGIGACGAGATLAAARQPAIVATGGRRVAFLAYSSILPAGYAAEAHRPGCAPLRAYTHYQQLEPDQPGTPPRVLTFADRTDLDALLEDVRAARTQADVVAISLHWGIHFVRAAIADYQREVAYAAIDAGADMILGHHPHVLKAIEFHRGKPILYSMGNFAIEQPSAFKEDLHLDEAFATISALGSGWAPAQRYMTPPETRHTFVARCAVGAAGEIGLSLAPCRIDDDSVPQPLRSGEPGFAEFLSYLREITEEAGVRTRFVEQGSRIEAFA